MRKGSYKTKKTSIFFYLSGRPLVGDDERGQSPPYTPAALDAGPCSRPLRERSLEVTEPLNSRSRGRVGHLSQRGAWRRVGETRGEIVPLRLALLPLVDPQRQPSSAPAPALAPPPPPHMPRHSSLYSEGLGQLSLPG